MTKNVALQPPGYNSQLLGICIIVTEIHCSFFFLNDFIYLLTGCAGSSLLQGLCSSCGEPGLLSSCSAWNSHYSDFSLLQSMGSRACGLSSYGSQPLEHRLNNCGIWAQLLCGMWNLPGSGIEPMSPALASGFFQ